jgi:hypothetical protein
MARVRGRDRQFRPRTSMVRRGRRFESVRGLFLEDKVAANRGLFVAATDTVEHLLVKEGVDGRSAQREKSKLLQAQRCRNGNG